VNSYRQWTKQFLFASIVTVFITVGYSLSAHHHKNSGDISQQHKDCASCIFSVHTNAILPHQPVISHQLQFAKPDRFVSVIAIVHPVIYTNNQPIGPPFQKNI